MDVSPRYGRILVLLIVAHALVAGAYSLWNPLAEAPDEADHFAYVRYLATEKKLPTGPSVTQSKHPPLYHITAAVAASIGDPADYQFLRANPDVTVRPAPNWSPNFFIHTTLEDWPWRDGPLAFHMARLWSVLLSTLTIAIVYFVVRTGFPDWPGLALVAAGILAFIPEFAFIGGTVNNDNGVALFGALILWGALTLYRRHGRGQAVLWTAVAMGLGLLVKVSILALWPVVLLAIIMGSVYGSNANTTRSASWIVASVRSWRRWLAPCLLVIAIATAIASPWLIRNWRLYGDLLGYSQALQTIDARTEPWTWEDTVWLLRGWFQSFWGKFGGAGHIAFPIWVYWTLATVSLLALFGVVRAWFVFSVKYRPVIFLLSLSIALVALGIWRYAHVALGADQGRLLYPAIAAIVSLMTLGLAAWTPRSLHLPAASVGIAALAALSVYGLVGVIRPAFAPPPLLAVSELSNEAEAHSIQFGEFTLVEWQTSPEPSLIWSASQQPESDWRTILRIVAEDGSLVWEWRRSPGYGRWSTDRWVAGTTLEDEYRVAWPDWAGPGRYRVELGAHPFGEDAAMPTVAGQPIAAPDHPYAFLGWLERQ